MSLVEFRVDLLAGDVERVDEALAELETSDWNILEQAVERTAVLVGFFPDEGTGVAEWEKLRSILPARVAHAAPKVRQVEEREWREAYREHFHAWQFRDLHWVPVWEKEKFRLPDGHEAVWLDPGMAFGTGNHETTRLCAERIVSLRDACRAKGLACESMSVIDAGCGSGILAISAVRSGFGEVVGFDNDPLAVEISRKNADANGVNAAITFLQSDLISGLSGRAADLVVANIQADVLMRFAAQLVAAVKPGGVLVLSGILGEECEAVRRAFEETRLSKRSGQFEMGEWRALEFQY